MLREACHGHDLVDPELGRGLDGLVVAVALGQRLHEDEPRLGLGLAADLDHAAGRAPALPAATTAQVSRSPAPSASMHLLPRPDPADGGGVPTLGAVEDHAAAHRGAGDPGRLDEEQRQGHGRCGRATWP